MKHEERAKRAPQLRTKTSAVKHEERAKRAPQLRTKTSAVKHEERAKRAPQLRTKTSAVSAVERYLDELFDRLAGTGGAGRRALAETEDHLRAAVAAGVERGLTEERAEQEAVDRFGSPARIAGELRAAHRELGVILRQAFVGAWLVGAVLALTIGVSGLLVEVFGAAFGYGFVAGDAPDITYTAQRCAEYQEYVPHAASCAEAAAVHHFGEIAQSREMAGVLGLLALLALLAARRWTRLRDPSWTPPRAPVFVALLALFGVAAAALGGMGILQLVFGLREGVGVDLADGLASGVAALAVVGLILASVRRVPAARHG